jgi:cell division protease FtsH
MNEGAILAARENRTKIAQYDLIRSIEKVMLGPEKKNRVMTEKDKEMTAYHEAGHAIVGHFLPHCDRVRKVSIIGRGMAGGYTLSMPDKDVHYNTLVKFNNDLAMILGGFVTEKLVYGDDMLSTGPSSDLKKATSIARSMVLRYGMSDKLGPRQYAENEEMIFLAQEIHDKKNYSEKTAEMIDEEIDRILAEARKTAERIIAENRAQMDKLVEVLIKEETVEEEKFVEIVGKGVHHDEDSTKARKA